MKTSALNTTLIAALLAASGAAHAGQGYGNAGGSVARAQVLSSTPIFDTINEPRRECWTETRGYETRSYRDGSNGGGAVLGAIVGGLVGSTIGQGNGKVAAAAVGAATGAVVGDRLNDGDRRYVSRPRQVEQCRVQDNYRQVISGYDVRYLFQGREYNTRLPYDPGRWLTLNVSFSVADDQRGGRWNNSDYDRND